MIFKKKYLFLILIPLLFLTYPLSYVSNFNITSNSYDNDVSISDNVSLTINDVTTAEDSVTVYYIATRGNKHLDYVTLDDENGVTKTKKEYSKDDQPDVIYDSIIYTFTDSKPSEKYDGWTLFASFSNNGGYNSDTADVGSFALSVPPDFASQSSLIVDRKDNVGHVNYELDMGSDAYEEPYNIKNVKVTYDGKVVGSSKNDTNLGTVDIDNINSYNELDNFVLVVVTDYDSDTTITQTVGTPSFSKSTGEFSDISSRYSVHEDKLTISYQIYMGNGTDGKYYQLNSNGVSLVNANNEVLASDENPSSVNVNGFVSGEIVISDYSNFYKDNKSEDLHLTASTSETEEDNNINSNKLDTNIMIDPETATNVWLIVVLVSSFLILVFLVALLFLIKKLNAKRSTKMNKTLNG